MSSPYHYLGNPLLKSAGVRMSFTEEQAREIERCRDDIIYFVKTYMKIIHVDHGIIPFELWKFQEEILVAYKENRKVIVKLSRQSGKTSISVAFFLWYVLFNKHKTCGILANKAPIAREVLSRLQFSYEQLPMWLQQGVLEWNKGSIVLENGSRIIASATSSTAIRGFAFSMILLDEFGFVPNNIAEEFFTSVFPTISSGTETKIFITSTPHGMNHYYKFWTEAANKKNGFVALEYGWDSVPGRTQAWFDEQKAILGDVKFSQEVLCEFLGSSNTLISGMKLRQLAFVDPLLSDNGLDMYELPDSRHVYVMTVDPARGVGGDASAFSIIDVTQYPFRQVAKYKSNEISPLLFPGLICVAAKRFNNAWVLIEINDNGQQIADALEYDLEYENIYKIEIDRGAKRASGGYKKSIVNGLRMTEPVKRMGCANLKTMVELDKLIIRDFDTISELTTFCDQGNTFKADEGYHDDLAMTLVAFSWLINQRIFKENSNTDIRAALQKEQLTILDDELTPPPILDNGLSDKEFELEDNDLWTKVKEVYPPGRLW